MSTLFISYSTKDRGVADLVYEQLLALGYERPFRDDHPRSGIPAGSLWERELYRKLEQCKALIVLCSRNWLESKWCFAELAYAKAIGKAFVPIRIDDSAEVPAIIAERQAIDRPGQERADHHEHDCGQGVHNEGLHRIDLRAGFRGLHLELLIGA
jgi:hypothetical protein